MRKARWLIAVLVLCAGGALSQRPPGGGGADQAAFEAVCGACHPVSMASDLRSESEWKETIALMVEAGAKGTGEQFAALRRYLRENWTTVNINTAKAAEIAPILSISEATARAIVRKRTEKGKFRTIAQLKRVPGVDAKKLEALKERIVF